MCLCSCVIILATKRLVSKSVYVYCKRSRYWVVLGSLVSELFCVVYLKKEKYRYHRLSLKIEMDSGLYQVSAYWSCGAC